MNLFVTGGTWVHGSGDPITEKSLRYGRCRGFSR
jgi:hypothetical protein